MNEPTRQVHLDFHTSEHIPEVGNNFSKEQFKKALKLGNINQINIFGKCHHGWCYYPTKIKHAKMHPNLKIDLLGQQIEACHEINVKSPIYLTVGWSAYDVDTHPEWCSRDIDGNIIDHSGEKKMSNNNEILYEDNTINYEHRTPPLKKTDEIKYFLESNENNFWPLKPKLNVEYVYLDEQEKKIIKSMDHQYLIERVQNSEFIGLYNDEIIELRLFNPTKELYMVPYRDDIIENNQFTNFSNLDYNGQEEHIYNYQNHILHQISSIPGADLSKIGLFRTDKDRTTDLKIDKTELNIDEDRYIESDQAMTIDDISELLKVWSHRDINDIPAINADNYTYFTPNIIESIEIKFNGDVRQASRDNSYYENVVPYIHHSNRIDGVLVYSFSLNPEKYQPSGACNFSNIKDAILEIKFKNTSRYESKGKKNMKYNMKIYNTTYNILKIYDNTCQLLFST